MPETLSTRALCSDADLFGLLKPNEAPTAEETELAIRLCNAASDAIYLLTGREYVQGAADETRLFPPDLYDYGLGYELEVGAMSEVSAVELVRRDGSTSAVASSNLILLPFARKTDEPITAVRILPSTSPYPHSNDQAVSVTGTFGYPSRPERVRQAAALTAAAWYTRDASRFSEVFVQETGARVPSARALPAEAYDLLRPDIPPHVG